MEVLRRCALAWLSVTHCHESAPSDESDRRGCSWTYGMFGLLSRSTSGSGKHLSLPYVPPL